LRRQPSRAGEHNAAVLAEAGLSAADIEALARSDVLVAL
jgi:crotonobetainyl-CoA:carnitine CoA-transferase CaiB-like acyl-CoA transferase